MCKCVDLENEVRGLLKIFGIKLPAGLGHRSFDQAAREPIMENQALAYALMPLLDVRLQLYQALLRAGSSGEDTGEQ